MTLRVASSIKTQLDECKIDTIETRNNEKIGVHLNVIIYNAHIVQH